MEPSEEEVAEWVAKQLTGAPERDEAWVEAVDAIWQAGQHELGESHAV